MPNHCEGDLYVRGTVEELKRFMKHARTEKTDLDHNQFIPYPRDFEEMDRRANQIMDKFYNMSSEEREVWLKTNSLPKDGFNSGGYQWCIKNWGTKWGFYNVRLDDRGIDSKDDKKRTSIVYHFETAWSPALPVAEKMSEMFPKLTFNYRYYEMGMAFQGKFLIKAGEVKEDTTKEYHGHRGG